jgi:hypothetical protein
VLAIALANKLARIAWAVLAKGRAFELRRTMTSWWCSYGVVQPIARQMGAHDPRHLS